MSSIVYESHKYALKLMAIYYGIPVFTLGVVGSCLNIIVFLSLKTFRQSSCAFYLLMMSIFRSFIYNYIKKYSDFGFWNRLVTIIITLLSYSCCLFNHMYINFDYMHVFSNYRSIFSNMSTYPLA